MLRIVLPFFFLVLLIASSGLTSCKKAVNFSNGNLSFSVDTLVFDTVFTTIGSTTQQFKFYNKDKRTVNIEEIELMGGENSVFRVNVDGLIGTKFENMEVEGKDSLYVFVEVTLGVNNATNPMVIEDSIRFRTNGVDQYVNLAVWGQDMYFHNNVYVDDVIAPWQNDKPHLIYGSAVIDTDKTLTIPAGTHVYLHKNSRLLNYQGTLNINGTLGNEVTFQGDRLESLYDNVSGQYYGIQMYEAKESKINYCNIKNGGIGIDVISADPSNVYTLRITNSMITNCAYYGLRLISGGLTRAENCIIAKNGIHALAVFGSDFSFNHCHLLGYSNAGSQNPAVGISNVGYDYDLEEAYITNINEGTITNSVIYGNLDTEFVIDTDDGNGMLTFIFNFDKNLIKSETIPTDSFFGSNQWNDEPYFVSPTDGDFLFYSISPLHSGGDGAYFNTIGEPAQGIGINGVARIGSAPDIGAYEIL